MKRGDLESCGCVDRIGSYPRPRFVREMGLDAVAERLVDKSVPVGKKENLLRGVSPQEDIDQRHDRAGLAGPRRHHEESFSFFLFNCFGDSTNRFDLVAPVDDRFIRKDSVERLFILL